MREQRRLSFVVFMKILVILSDHTGPVTASSLCSNTFRFDQLCPDPRHGPLSTNSAPDTIIKLNDNTRTWNGFPGYNGRSSSNGAIYTSLMLLKDPSTFSCDFLLNGVETAVITGIHVTDNPWDFRHANSCNHVVKISYDLHDKDQSVFGSSTVNNNRQQGKNSKHNKICGNEIGIRRQTANNDVSHPNHHDMGTEEELAKKLNVYFWHNFSISPHSAEFTDTITNFHLSRDDLACPTGTKSGQFAQIVVVVSKSGICEIILQQYEIVLDRSPWGCKAGDQQIPFPVKFCGSYKCSQSNTILTSLKLLSRRFGDRHKSRPYPPQPPTEIPIKTQGPPAPPVYDYNGEANSKGNDLYNYDDKTTSTSNPSSTEAGEKEGEDDDSTRKMKEEADWEEAAFLYTFPTLGVLFIIVVLSILSSRTGSLTREMCRGYPYPTEYAGSSYSINKNTLPI